MIWYLCIDKNEWEICFDFQNWGPLMVIIICPFEKRMYYAVAMSVRPSVHPSVHPRFPDFSSTCFEISIWNLLNMPHRPSAYEMMQSMI